MRLNASLFEAREFYAAGNAEVGEGEFAALFDGSSEFVVGVACLHLGCLGTHKLVHIRHIYHLTLFPGNLRLQ